MLNDRQRELLTDSIWVINTVLKEQGLQGDNDMFSIASLCLSRAVARFDESRGVKWTTYAYKSLTRYMRTTSVKEKVRASKIVSDTKLFYMKDNTDIENEQYYKYVIGQIKDLLTDREKLVLECKLNGVPFAEIGNKLGVTHQMVSEIWGSIRKKAIENIDFEP